LPCCMKLLAASLLAAVAVICAAEEEAARVFGPHYEFAVAAPKGWKLTSTKEFQAAFHPADTAFEKSAVVMYVRSANKSELHVANITELNRLDLKGIQKRHPAAVSEIDGTLKTAVNKAILVYSFEG